MGWYILCSLIGILATAATMGTLLVRTRKQLDQMAEEIKRSDKENADIQKMFQELDAKQAAAKRTSDQLEDVRKESGALTRRNSELEDALAAARRENEELRSEVARRVTRQELRYGIATVGISGCGKTALTWLWANQVAAIEQIRATKFSKYERTVAQVFSSDTQQPISYIFEIYDWGGEHIDDALTALVKLGKIHALVAVVDLGIPSTNDKNRHEFSQERINQQLEEFNRHALKFFFAASVVDHCKHYILFINKVDILPGYIDDIEAKAKQYYSRLIDDMRREADKRGVDFKIIVGSASTGQRVRNVFSHLIHDILPDEALSDPQLRSEMGENTGKHLMPRPRAGQHEVKG